jgi:hypothetical protein
MKTTTIALAALFVLSLPFPALSAQEGFGFGAVPADAAAPSGAVKAGGSIEFVGSAPIDALDDIGTVVPGDMARAAVSLDATGSGAEATLRLELSRALLAESPARIIDEAAVRIFSGPLALEGGLLKASWGKADSQGPLDVLNPRDNTDLAVTDEMERKMAVPMLKASLALGERSRLEAVVLPGFEPDRIAFDGPWMPKAIGKIKTAAYSRIYRGANPTANNGAGDGLYYYYYASAGSSAYAVAYSAAYSATYAPAYDAAYAQAYAAALGAGAPADQAAVSAMTAAASAAGAAAAAQASSAASTASAQAATAQAAVIEAQAGAATDARLASLMAYPDTDSLEHFQGGLRFTTTIAGADLGLQYFYGFLPTPAMDYSTYAVSFNRYHQAGADFATVLAGFNVRAEIAANLTRDLEGDDPAVYNPALAFSVGFDRGLFAGLNLNLQYAGTYRLLDEGITSSLDIEADADILSTQVTAVLSQSLFKDTLEWRATLLWGVEEGDYLVVPSLAIKVGDAAIELSAGIFGGESDGDLGQFEGSSYLKVGMKYRF